MRSSLLRFSSKMSLHFSPLEFKHFSQRSEANLTLWGICLKGCELNDGIFFLRSVKQRQERSGTFWDPDHRVSQSSRGQKLRSRMGMDVCLGYFFFYGFKPQIAICSKSCSPAPGKWNISAFLWQLLLNEPCPHKFTQYLCAGGLGNRQADKKLSLHGALEDRALWSAVIPAGLNRNHDLSALGNVSVLPPSQFNSIMLFFSLAVTVEVYMRNGAVARILVSTPNLAESRENVCIMFGSWFSWRMKI